MSLQQLSPILDIVGHANKHVARAAKFLHKYGEIGLFPVRLQVMPLRCLLTLYAIASSWQLFWRLANLQLVSCQSYVKPCCYTSD